MISRKNNNVRVGGSKTWFRVKAIITITLDNNLCALSYLEVRKTGERTYLRLRFQCYVL